MSVPRFIVTDTQTGERYCPTYDRSLTLSISGNNWELVQHDELGAHIICAHIEGARSDGELEVVL